MPRARADVNQRYRTDRGPASPPETPELVTAGRGWEVFDYPVTLEFETSTFCTKSELQTGTDPIDDGRYPSFLERLFARRTPKHAISRRSPAVARVRTNPALVCNSSLVELQVGLPGVFVVTPELMERLLLNVTNRSIPTSFEIVADEKEIITQFAVRDVDAGQVELQLKSHFPECVVSRAGGYLRNLFQDSEGESSGNSHSLIVDFGLKHEFFYPLQMLRSFDPDPLIGLVSAVSDLKEDETFVLQILFQPARGDLAQAFIDFLTDETGNPQYQESKDLLSQAKQKLSRPLMSVAIRCGVKASSHERRLQLVRGISGTLDIVGSPNSNRLIPLQPGKLQLSTQIGALLDRQSYRKGMMLNISELTALAHLPSTSVKTPALTRGTLNTKAAPMFATEGELMLGENQHCGTGLQVRLDLEKRTKHMHLVGASGSGKSSLLTQIMYQDIEQGNGFACFDPHGDLIDKVTESIPDHRIQDVVLFDPSDAEYPIGFNILSAHSELEKTLLSSDLVAIFRRFATSWGDQMNSVLSNAVLAFLHSNRGGNLLDLKRFLVDKTFRHEFLETVTDEEIRFYWQREFPELRGKPHASLLTRLDTFLRSEMIRHIVAQRENKLDFRALMDQQKILLVKLSLGAIGEENAFLLGSLLVAKIYMAALSRQEISEKERKPFFLYLDEAHHFSTPSMNQILSGVRKYKIGLTLAHQQLAQFQQSDAEILASVLSNCYTRICFRVDDSDAERLAKGFSFFTSDHLRNLGVGEAIARFEQSQFSFNLKTYPPEKVSPDISTEKRNAVIEGSRARYAKPRSEVVAELRRQQPESVGISTERTKPVVPSFQSPEPAVDTITGRGGRHHQELQDCIRRMSEKLGFQVEIEKSILGGGERVDVSLLKDEMRIACEVSVTTTDYEVQNAQKCLVAGYDRVFVVASNKKKIPLLKGKIEYALSADARDQVSVVDLPGLLVKLRQITGENVTPRKNNKDRGTRLSFNEACELLGVTSSTLYRWIREGKIPYYRPGREYQFDHEELLLVGKNNVSGKRKTTIDVLALEVGQKTSKSKKQQDARYKKLLKLD